MEHHGLAVARRLAEPDVAWDDGLEDLAREVAMNFLSDLNRHARPPIEHGEHNTADLEIGVQPLPNELDGLEQMREPLQGVELALERNDHAIGGDECVDRKKPQGWRAIDDGPAVIIGSGKRCLEPAFALLDPDQLDLGADQVYVGWQELEMREVGGEQSLAEGLGAQQHVIDGWIQVGLLDSQSAGGVALRIKINDQGGAVREGETGRKIHSRGGLADPAFLVHHRNGLANRLAFSSDLADASSGGYDLLQVALRYP